MTERILDSINCVMTERRKGEEPNFRAGGAKRVIRSGITVLALAGGLGLGSASAYAMVDTLRNKTSSPPGAELNHAREEIGSYEQRFGTARTYAFGETNPTSHDANNPELQRAYGIVDQKAKADADKEDIWLYTAVSAVGFVGAAGTVGASALERMNNDENGKRRKKRKASVQTTIIGSKG